MGFFFFFFCGSEQEGGVRVASVLQRLVVWPRQDEQNGKHIHGEETSSYNITRMGPRIANKSGRSVSNKLGISRGGRTLNSGC